MIDRKTLTASLTGVSKTYDGGTAATLGTGNYLLEGLVGTQSAIVTQTQGQFASADAGAAVGVGTTLSAGQFTAGAGTNLANYTLPVTASGVGVIDRKTLTASLTGVSKTYDGGTAATLGTGNYLLEGLVGTQSAIVTQTQGQFASADAGAAVGVGTTLSAGQFTAGAGTNLANYTLPVTASGVGVIDPVQGPATPVVSIETPPSAVLPPNWPNGERAKKPHVSVQCGADVLAAFATLREKICIDVRTNGR